MFLDTFLKKVENTPLVIEIMKKEEKITLLKNLVYNNNLFMTKIHLERLCEETFFLWENRTRND